MGQWLRLAQFQVVIQIEGTSQFVNVDKIQVGTGCNYQIYEDSTACVFNADKMKPNINFYSFKH